MSIENSVEKEGNKIPTPNKDKQLYEPDFKKLKNEEDLLRLLISIGKADEVIEKFNNDFVD